MWDICEYYCQPTVWRELFYLACGMSIFFITHTFEAHGGLDRLDASYTGEDSDEYTTLTVLIVFKAIVSFTGSVVHYVGCWTLIDSYGCCLYGTPSYNWRNLACVIIGLLILGISGTFNTNCCVSPAHLLPREDVDSVLRLTKHRLKQSVKIPGKVLGRVSGELVRVLSHSNSPKPSPINNPGPNMELNFADYDHTK